MVKLDPSVSDRIESLPANYVWAMIWSQLHGFPILPCNTDKSPLTSGGKHDATRDPAVIAGWWLHSCSDALIGGRTDGLVVVDCDAYKPGHLDDLRSLGELPGTLEVRTPGRDGVSGRHLFYRGEGRSTKVGKSIDIRAGISLDYVILAPSTSTGGTYEVTNWRPVAQAPARLLTISDKPLVAVTSVEGGLPALEPISPGMRVMVPRPTDRSAHTYALIRSGMRAGLTDGQLRTLAEADRITQERIAEGKRAQPGWWPEEFARCLYAARQDIARTSPIEDPTTYSVDPTDEKETKGQKVMRLAERDYELVLSAENEVFGLPRSGPRILHQLKGGVGSMRTRIAAQYEQEFGSSPSNTDLAEMVTVLEGRASYKPVTNIPMRTARWQDGILLDLGDPTGRAVFIRPGSWSVLDVSPVPFRRTPLVSALPEPERGFKLKDTLYPILNVPADDRALIVACALSWLWPDISHPVMYLHGEEGTAKTTMARRLRSLVDPSVAETKRKPGRDEDWEVIVAGQSLVVLDNLSTLPEWLSDAICTAVSGTSDVKRRMYANQDLSVVSLRRSFILTSIKQLIEHGDLVDRSVSFEPFPITQFMPESKLDRDWTINQPRALGALLDLAASVLAELPSIEADWEGRERLADFAQLCAAMDRSVGSRTLSRYRAKISEGIQATVETDAFAVHILSLAEQGWTGSSAQLYATYHGRYDKGTEGAWPKNPAQVGIRLSRIAALLRKSGIAATKNRSKAGSTWTFSRV